jgi:hypothetical protein
MSAAAIAAALGGGSYRSGAWWRCRCPVHGSRGASLAIGDGPKGQLRLRCFGGCRPARVMAELRRRGLIGDRPGAPDPDPEVQREATLRDRSRRIEAARWIWQETEAPNYVIETYLGGRLILLDPPITIRLHRSLRHKEADCRRPAMVAMVEHTEHDGVVGVHCTYLRPDGSGKASVDPVKRFIGPVGGGAVRLAPAAR